MLSRMATCWSSCSTSKPYCGTAGYRRTTTTPCVPVTVGFFIPAACFGAAEHDAKGRVTNINYLENWSSVESGPFFEMDESVEWSNRVLPSTYFELARSCGGREGFLGQEYLRLYRLEELRSLNEAYQSALYCPGLVIFGSDGYGEAFAFFNADPRVLKIPVIPIPDEGEQMEEVVAPDFETFARFHGSTPPTLRPNSSTVGLEFHLKQPLCMGGDWNDEKNCIMVTPIQHAELARYWNRTYRGIVRLHGEGVGDAS